MCESLESRDLLAGDLAGEFGHRTVLVADLNTTPASFEVVSDIDFAGSTYVLTRNYDNTQLWKTDGSRNGSELVVDVPGRPKTLLEGTRRLYFAVQSPWVDDFTETQLWSTDGTTAAQQMEFATHRYSEGNSGESSVFLEEVNGTLLAAVSWHSFARDAFLGELWSNVTGTFAKYEDTSGVRSWNRVGDEVYFEEDTKTWSNGLGHAGLFISRTNPITLETTLVKETVWKPMEVTPTVTEFEELPEFEEATRAGAVSEEWSHERVQYLFGADATTEGHWFVNLAPTPNGLLFQTGDGRPCVRHCPPPNPDLWVTNGTKSGTGRLLNQSGRPLHVDDGEYLLLSPESLDQVILDDNTLSVVSTDRESIVRTDGTQGGTFESSLSEGQVVLIPAGEFGRWSLYTTRCGSLVSVDEQMTVTFLIDQDFSQASGCLNGAVNIAVTDRIWYVIGGALWVSDGTPDRTRFVDSISSNLAFIRDDAFYSHDGMIWTWRFGTPAPRPLAGLPTFGPLLSNLGVLNDQLFFMDNLYRLWASDGTPEGTSVVKEYPLPPPSVLRHRTTLVEAGGRLFFTADDGQHGVELWSTDGTAEGTKLAADINPGADDSDPERLVLFGQHLFFSANDGFHGNELWRLHLDGPIEPVPGDSDRDGLVSFRDFLMLTNNFGQETQNGDRDGDFDGDGFVSFKDFLVLATNFGRQVST